jgi:hypothetical protein
MIPSPFGLLDYQLKPMLGGNLFQMCQCPHTGRSLFPVGR